MIRRDRLSYLRWLHPTAFGSLPGHIAQHAVDVHERDNEPRFAPWDYYCATAAEDWRDEVAWRLKPRAGIRGD